MVLFGRCHISYDEAERALGRTLSGTPSDGEIAILALLNNDKFQAVREALATTDLTDDFRAMVETRLALVSVRAGRYSTQRVRIPIETLTHYQALAQRNGASVAECLEQAIERDRGAHDTATQAADRLAEGVAAYHKAAGQLATKLNDLCARAGSIEETTARLGRIEGVLQSLANRK